MAQKFLLLLTLMIFVLSPLKSQNQTGSIIIYREKAFQASTVAYKINVNDTLSFFLNNNSYIEIECPVGDNYFSVARKGDVKTINIKANQVNYLKLSLRIGFFRNVIDLIEVNHDHGVRAINLGGMRKRVSPYVELERPKNRVGIDATMGGGFENEALITSQNGRESFLSFGGGFGININAGREVTKHLDLALDFGYCVSDLQPYLTNASCTFKRYRTQFTPSLIIPIQGGYSSRLKLGVGIDYYFQSSLKIETSELQNGFNDLWHYRNVFGLHEKLIYELNPAEFIGFYMGFSVSHVSYEFWKGDGNTSPNGGFLSNPRGGGFDMILGVSINF